MWGKTGPTVLPARSVGLGKPGKGAVVEVEANIQPFAAACQPICSAAEGQAIPLDSALERLTEEKTAELTAWDWHEVLEELKGGLLRYQDVHPALEDTSETALGELRERVDHLAQLVAEMREEFKNTLKQVTDSGNSLLSAAGDLQRNRNIVFKMVPATSRGTRQAAEELMLCRTTVLAAAKSNGEVLMTARAQLKQSHMAVAQALRHGATSLRRASEVVRWEGELIQLSRTRGWLLAGQVEELLDRSRQVLVGIKQDGTTLEATGQELTTCRKAFRRAIVINRSVIRQAEISLQCDQEIVFNWALGHVSNGRKCDRNFVLKVVEANGEALEQVPAEFQGDREIALLAVQRSEGWALQFASENLKHDRDIVLAAVSRSGFALEHAADELKQDRSVVLAAVQSNGEALEFAAETLRSDREVALTAVRRSGGMAISSVGQGLQGDPEIAMVCVSANGLSLEHVSPELRADRATVLAAVQANGLALEHASPELRADRGVVQAAVQSNAQALRFASPELQGCREVVAAAVAADGFTLEFASEGMRSDRVLVLAAIAEGGAGVLEFASPSLRDDEEVQAVAAAVSSERRRQTEEGPPPEAQLWQSPSDPESVRL